MMNVYVGNKWTAMTLGPFKKQRMNECVARQILAIRAFSPIRAVMDGIAQIGYHLGVLIVSAVIALSSPAIAGTFLSY